MNQNKTEQTSFVFTGKHMLAIMCLFFGVIIAVNFTMASMARGTWTGLVVKNSYVASQKFNSELTQAKLQQASGIYSEISYENSELRFVLKDRDGKAIAVENVTAEIGRPAFEQKDQLHQLVSCGEACQKLNVALQPGVWFVKLKGQYRGLDYRRDVRMLITDDGRGLLE